ncbi:hypothetical protein CPB84DRAFT_704831 [Gymnopilus junonius]|uniref:Uncharacterized protein n=1 Tax=Gymnopilus junonius TaxID=109634 RepID=A0A9P5NAL8_GYMJU|nr:hypothetical protein CPB84DRAFT_704831 [Gymnopilus junonius]
MPPGTTLRPPKRTPVPLLLESFPVPPSHIPPTPTTPLPLSSTTSSHHPPLSGPPSTPLPPVPGPSRISEHEQLLLLSSAVNRSRRSSKYSVTSSSQRESVISVTSSAGVHLGASSRTSIASDGAKSPPAARASPLPPSHKRERDSTLSSSGSSSSGRPSISISSTSPSATTRLAAPGADQPQLTRLSISPIPLSDIEDDDDSDLVPPHVMPSPTLPRAASTSVSASGEWIGNGNGNTQMPTSSFSSRRHHHQPHHEANESISSIDMRDLLGLDTVQDEDEEEDEPLGGLPPLPLSKSSYSPSKLLRHHHQASLADPIDPHTIYTRTKPEDRPAPSASASRHKKSSPSIGSFSLPSSSKYSPVTTLAPFVPSSSGRGPASPPLPPLLPPAALSLSSAYGPAEEKGVLPPSVSTTTQLSMSTISNSPLLESSSLPYDDPDPDSEAVLDSILDLGPVSPSPSSLSVSQLSLSQLSMSPSPSPSFSSSVSPSSSSLGVSSPTVKDMRLGLRAERTRSAGLKHVLRARSRSRSVAKERERMPEPGVGLPPVPPVPLGPGGGLGDVSSTLGAGVDVEAEALNKPRDDGFLRVDQGSMEDKRNSSASTASGFTATSTSGSGSASEGVGLGLTGHEMGKVLSGIVITQTTMTEVEDVSQGGDEDRRTGRKEMTLDELGLGSPRLLPARSLPKSQGKLELQAQPQLQSPPPPSHSHLPTTPASPTSSPKKDKSIVFPPQKSTTTRTPLDPDPEPSSQATPKAASKMSMSASTPQSEPRSISTSQLNPTAQSKSTSQSRSVSHLKLVQARGGDDPRAPSPDIATILSTTPRPALSKSLSSSSSAARSRAGRTRSRVSSAGSSKSRSGSGAGAVGAGAGAGQMGKRRVSEGSTTQYFSSSLTLSRTSTMSSGASRLSGASASAGMGRTKSLEGRALRAGEAAVAQGQGRRRSMMRSWRGCWRGRGVSSRMERVGMGMGMEVIQIRVWICIRRYRKSLSLYLIFFEKRVQRGGGRCVRSVSLFFTLFGSLKVRLCFSFPSFLSSCPFLS